MQTQVQPGRSSSIREKIALVTLKRAVFHFVPVHKKSEKDIAPTLMDEETPLDRDNTHLIQERVKSALTSPHSFEVEFNPNKLTPVRSLLEEYFADSSQASFILISQKLASTLFTVQKGSNSPGLLALLDCRLGKEHAAIVVKLESETGSRLFTEEDGGHRRYRMQVLRDLFLTEGTRVFKSALFVPSVDGMQVLACDDQRSSIREYEIARFFLEQFLGCKRLEVAHVVTKNFYNATITFLNEQIPNHVDRNDIYDDLASQMRRHTRSLNVKEFARDFVPSPHRDEFVAFMKEREIPPSFEKDTSEINGYLRKKNIRTTHDIQIRVPEGAANLVKVEANRITINDSPEMVRGNA
jgi:hypothetical protein